MTSPRSWFTFVAILAGTSVAGLRAARADDSDLAELARAAAGEEKEAAARAIASLRAAGPRGLEALLALRDAEAPVPRIEPAALLSRLGGTQPTVDGALPARRLRLSAAIDRVAAQKDARFAGLYWHTDEGEALRRAAAEGKPVLSLRLLGRLDEDASCANSRFFRTALYPDPHVSRLLRERFVLHWESMRPVPRITIDFGDGRVLERPITGNSVHLVLDAQGQVIDAIPGLLGPRTFLEALEAAEALARRMTALDKARRTAELDSYHRERLEALDEAWAADLAALGLPFASPSDLDDADVWTAIAARHADDARLAPPGLTLFREKHRAIQVNRLTVGKFLVEDPLMRVVQRFQNSLAADSVRNEQRMHRAVHLWFTTCRDPLPARAFAEQVYRELFLTPPEDPWLGLLPADEYAALDGGGWHDPAASAPGR